MRKDWEECTFGEIAIIYNGDSINAQIKKDKYQKITNGFNYIGTKDIDYDGTINYINGVKIPTNENKFKIAPKGCVLVCSEGGSAGRKTAYVDEDICFGNKLYAITNQYSVFEGKYIYYYTRFRGFFEDFKNQMNGIIGGVSANKFSEIPFPLSPLPIQRAIVSKIEALFSDLDNGIANFKKAQAQLKIYRQAVLKKAFEGELTKEWRQKQTNLPTAEELLKQIKEERQNQYNQQIEDWKKAVKVWEKNGKVDKKPNKPTQPKELSLLKEKELKELPLIPDGWFYSEIGNICNCIVPNRDKPKSFSGDIKWITTPDLDEKLIKLDYSKIEIGLTKNEAEKYNARVIPINSVIMTCVGTLGLSSIVEKEIVINQQLHAFLPENYYLPKSLAYYIRLNKNFYERISTSTTIQYVNKDKCNSLPFPLCSLSEQNQIVQEIEFRLSVCDKMEQSINESIEKAEVLRQSILKKTFEGKLLSQAEIELCKKETDYEPASELLKKIQAEKAERITNEKLRITNKRVTK